MEKLNLQPNTPEWLEARKNYRTASEAPIVCGISPFQTPEKFKLIKLGLAKQYYSKAMADGHKYEDQVRQWANKELGYDFKEEIWVNGDYLASLDGIDGDTLVEIKVSERTFDDIKAGRLPEYYITQMQQQMHCSPATQGYLVAYSKKRDDYAISPLILEEPSYMKQIADSWELFDQIKVDEHTPVDCSDDGRIVELFKRYDRLKAELDTIKSYMDMTRDELIRAAGDRSMVAGDFKLVRSKGTTRYDYKKAAADAKVDLEKYKSEGKPTFSVKLPPNPFKE
jgi:putative phage-type endonuclease